MSLASKLNEIDKRIRTAAESVGREAKEITIIAVTKTLTEDHVRRAHELGIINFAENYVQEFVQKRERLTNLNLKWHFIGHLQSNKVKQIVGYCDYIHSVERIKIIDEIDKHAHAFPGPDSVVQKILIEVNLVGEKSKSGCAPEVLPQLLEHAQKLKTIKLCGLMFMPPLNLSAAEQDDFYERARALRDESMKYVSYPHSLSELSMGTSHDYECAIRHGSTFVRIGTSLFGARA